MNKNLIQTWIEEFTEKINSGHWIEIPVDKARKAAEREPVYYVGSGVYVGDSVSFQRAAIDCMDTRVRRLFTPPFSFDEMGGYIWDAQSEMLADNCEDADRVLRIRGWGRLQHYYEPEQLQDAVGKHIAQVLTAGWNRNDINSKILAAQSLRIGELKGLLRRVVEAHDLLDHSRMGLEIGEIVEDIRKTTKKDDGVIKLR